MTIPPLADRRRHPPGLVFERWAAGDGWPIRGFDWPADGGGGRGSLFFLGGRGDFVEKHLEALHHWRSAGWNVGGFDWRGQGGSGRLARDPLVCHVPSFDPLLDDLDHLFAAWQRRRARPHVIVAHSMGAHLALRLMTERRPAIAAAALASPMVGIRAAGLSSAMLGRIAGAAVRGGLGERAIWRSDPGNVGGRLTACPDRQQDKLWWKREHPEIASGAPSWAWLRAAARSIGQLDRSLAARPIETPVLMVVSSGDAIVDVSAVERLAGRLRNARLLLLPGRGHELLREADPVRLAVMAEIDAFLETHVKDAARAV
ncbi:alpha/beta hydrolase [Sphingomonas jejuensis]|uniref:alpha/beta hydrolase n=1 Tax=Sphingomonas jejuensis TaxID=904715 RepID=UPI001439A1A9